MAMVFSTVPIFGQPAPADSRNPIDAYVAAPDDAFAWQVSDTVESEGVETVLIDMSSQRWLTRGRSRSAALDTSTDPDDTQAITCHGHRLFLHRRRLKHPRSTFLIPRFSQERRVGYQHSGGRARHGAQSTVDFSW